MEMICVYTSMLAVGMDTLAYLPHLHYKHTIVRYGRVFPVVEYYALWCLVVRLLDLNLNVLRTS